MRFAAADGAVAAPAPEGGEPADAPFAESAVREADFAAPPPHAIKANPTAAKLEARIIIAVPSLVRKETNCRVRRI